MPYIKQVDRAAIKPNLDYLLLYLNEHEYNPGLMNYIITRLVFFWWKASTQNYATLASITGVLENVKQEMYRRLASPYEDCKKEEHGDVY